MSLRLILAGFFAVMAIGFALVAIVSIIRSAQGFSVTRKGIKLSSFYAELGIISIILAGIVRDPSKLSAWISGLILLSIANGIYLLVHLLYISMWERRKH